MTVTQAYLFDATSWMSVDGMPGSVYFRLHNDLGTMPPGPELPLEPYPLSEFAWTEFSCTLTGPPSPGNPSGTYLNFYGAVDAFYAVPEPCSMLLFALGTVAFAIRRK